MEFPVLHKANKTKQYVIVAASISVCSLLCYFLSAYIGYRVIALILLVTVSLLAMFLDIFPVLLAAFSSALIWNFFFIPPQFTFYIGNTEDALMFLMYFAIASINAVLTYKIRQAEKKAREKEEKEKTLKLYNTLLNSLSHELRTPISAIIGATDNLQSENLKLPEETKQELLSEISKASFRLNKYVENLLNMSRIDSGFLQPKRDWCDVNELVHDVVNHLRSELSDRPVSINIPADLPLFKLDYGLLQTALNNLIRNAIHYTPHNSPITIKAAKVSTVKGHFVSESNNEVSLQKDNDEDKLEIIVEDNGKGFPEDEINKVFDKFYRLESSKTGGTGLGLSIVKGFVEAQNGIVRLENIPKSGARFTIEIPAETSYINNLKNE